MVKLQQCIDCGREWKRAYQKTVRLLSKNTDRPWTFPVTQTAKSLQSECVWDVEIKLCLPPAFIPCHFFALQLFAIERFEGWFIFTLSVLLHSQVRACSNLKSLSSPSRTENFLQPSRKEAFFCRSMHSSNAAATFWRFAKDFSNLLAVPLLPNRSTNGTLWDLGKAFEGQWQPQHVR